MNYYLSDTIGDEYKHWGQAKVFLNAPTGAGKTTLILQKLLPYYRKQGLKLLILCNRRMLNEQYEAALATMYETYSEYDNVEIQSYQHLAHASEGEIQRIKDEFYGICLDECHYFVQDSDFNPETYLLWKIITETLFTKQMIFISATMDCMRPFINYFKEQIYHNPLNVRKASYENFIDDGRYAIEPDYSYFDLIGVPGDKTLCERIVSDGGKALIFINSRDGAKKLKSLLEDSGLQRGTVKILNADELDRQDELKNFLVYGEKFPDGTKVLITTSVLDNGVSLTDSDINSVTVFTTSETDFLQMIGRIRVGKDDSRRVKLYLVERTPAEFVLQKQCLKEEVNVIAECEKCLTKKSSKTLPLNFGEILQNTRQGEILRKICYQTAQYNVIGSEQYLGTCRIFLNPMSVHKIKQNYHSVKAAYTASMRDSRYLPNQQAKWIGFTPSDIAWKAEETVEHKLRSFILDAMQKKINNDKFREVKKNVVEICEQFKIGKKYGLRNDRTPENAKFKKICDDIGLEFSQKRENDQTWYTVSEKGGSL